MDKEIKARWVDALRSGKYTQGRERLRTEDNCFCCLGVLCDVIDSTKWNHSSDGWKYIGPADAADWGAMMLPMGTRRSINLQSPHAGNLADMNDAQGKSFAEIAKYIEDVL